MLDKLLLHSKEYHYREIYTKVGAVLISSDELESNLFDDKGKYVSEEAKYIDEMIYFYVPTNVLFYEETVIQSFLDKTVT